MLEEKYLGRYFVEEDVAGCSQDLENAQREANDVSTGCRENVLPKRAFRNLTVDDHDHHLAAMSQDSQRGSQDKQRSKTPVARNPTPKPARIDDEQRNGLDAQTRRTGPLEDTLANPFVPFLQEQALVTPYHAELNKDVEFQERGFYLTSATCL